MKKIFSVVLSLFTLLGVLMTSCSADAESGGGSAPDHPAPVIKTQPESVSWTVGEPSKKLSVVAEISNDDGLIYQWYKKDGTAIEGATDTAIKDATDNEYTPTESGSYYVVVSNAGDPTKSVKSNTVSVVITEKDELQPPTIEVNLAESDSYDKASEIQTLSITAKVTEGADIYYQWYKDDSAIGEPSTDASTYKPEAFGSYYCKLYASKDNQTSQTVISKTIEISESDITADVSVNPTSVYTDETLEVTVTYNVEEADVKYQWVKVKTDNNSGADQNVSGATSKTFTPKEAGKYYCNVTVTSKNRENNSTVEKSTSVEVIALVIKTQPVDVSWTEGGAAKKLSVVAEISNDDGLNYQWYKDGKVIEGATKTEYEPSVGGLYYVVVSNAKDANKSVKSNEVRVTISPATLPEFDLFVCNSSGEKKEVTDITYDTSADFPVSSFYVKSTNYNETDFSIGDVLLYVKAGDDYIDQDYDGVAKIDPKDKKVHGYKIDFSNIVPNKEGDYKIEVYAFPNADKSKETYVSVNVTVKKGGATPDDPTPVNPTPEIIQQPESVQCEEGSTPDPLTVKAAISSGTIAYQWYKDGNLIPDATSATYQPTEKGSYYVVVSNADDSTKYVKSNTVSVVITAKGELQAPTIKADLAESVSYDKASDIKALSITATATEGADIYYLWYKDGSSIGAPSKTASTYAPTAFGSYYCALYASKGDQTSQSVNSKTIVISESDITATVSVTPDSAYTNTELKVTVTYNVAAADVKYQWVKTDNTSGADANVPDATSATYTPTEAGRYYCKVTVTSQNDKTNSKVVKSNYVEVTAKTSTEPAIPTINSINEKTAAFELSVKEGGKLELTVDASVSDGGTLTYAWYESKSASPIGTGATYSKANVTSADAGEYYVTVTNKLNGNTKEASSFRVKVEISSQDIGSGNGGFDFN